MHSFFKCSLDQKSISACLLPKRLYRCHHFEQNIPNFIVIFRNLRTLLKSTATAKYVFAAVIHNELWKTETNKMDRRKSTNHNKQAWPFEPIKTSFCFLDDWRQRKTYFVIAVDLTQPTVMTFWTCVHLHKVTWSCDWCISIRLVCFVCRTMDMKTYTSTLKAKIQQNIHSVDMSVFLLFLCSHCSYLRSKIEDERQLSRENLLTYVTLGQPCLLMKKYPTSRIPRYT